MASIETYGARQCPSCGQSQPILTGEAVWPPGWRCPACASDIPVSDGIPLYAPDLADTISGFDPAIFEYLFDMEPGHFWFETRNILLCGLANRYFITAGQHLEIGCGTGFVLNGFANAFKAMSLTASELHPAGLHIAKKRLGSRASFVQMDARYIPASNAFEVIGLFDVIEHINEDELVLNQVYNALKKGGLTIVAVPQHPFLWSSIDTAAYHVRRYKRRELERKLEAAGFEIVFSTSFTVFLLPLMIVSRLVLKRRMASAGEETRPPPFLNSILRFLLRLEVYFTLKGVRWPVGGSRVVVARKRD